MYAVISSGGKQYRLREGDLVQVEFLDGVVGDRVVFDQVLILEDNESVQLGTPFVNGAQVIGTIEEQGKGEKVAVLKFKRRKMYRKRSGHRQLRTAVRIGSVLPKSEAEALAGEGAAKEKKAEQKTAAGRTRPRKSQKKAGSKEEVSHPGLGKESDGSQVKRKKTAAGSKTRKAPEKVSKNKPAGAEGPGEKDQD